MRFAYLIMAHNEPELFGILMNLLDDERNDIYVHIDKKADISLFDKFKLKRSRLYFIDRMSVYWGDESQVKAEFALLRAAQSNGDYDYYHLLSGVDLPLKSQDYIHQFFEEHRGKEFVGVTFSDFNLKDLERKTRYYYLCTKYFRSGGGILSWWLRKIPNALVLLQRVFNVKRKYDVPLAKGPNWFSISNDLCKYILGRERMIIKRFKYTSCPDEMFLQTEVMNSVLKSRIFDINDQFNSCMREIDWKRGDPYAWKDCDYEELKRSNRLFARKFSSKYMGVVKRIEGDILNKK